MPDRASWKLALPGENHRGFRMWETAANSGMKPRKRPTHEKQTKGKNRTDPTIIARETLNWRDQNMIRMTGIYRTGFAAFKFLL